MWSAWVASYPYGRMSDRGSASARVAERGNVMTQQTSYETYSDSPAANYERYFVPAIGGPVAHDLIELA